MIPSWRNRDKSIFAAHWPVGLVKWISNKFSERFCLKTQVRNDRGIRLALTSGLDIRRHAYAYTHKHTANTYTHMFSKHKKMIMGKCRVKSSQQVKIRPLFLR